MRPLKTTDALIRPAIADILHHLHPDTLFYEEVGATIHFTRNPTYRDVRLDLFGVDATGCIGIEIKSDSDSLVRFKRQEPCYSKLCRTNYLVIGEKFLAKLQDVPHYWGIVLVYDGGDGMHAELVREPSDSPYYDPYAVLSLIWQDEVKHLLKKHGLYKGMSKERLKYQRKKLRENLDLEELLIDIAWLFAVRDGWKVPFHERCQPDPSYTIVYREEI